MAELQYTRNGIRFKSIVCLVLIGSTAQPIAAQTKAELAERVVQLEQELAAARNALSEATTRGGIAEERATRAEAQLTQAEEANTSEKIQIGDFTIGGAMRVNYVIGDYASSDQPSRGGDGGNFELDTFRLNLDYANGP
jgi:hypothetical protein